MHSSFPGQGAGHATGPGTGRTCSITCCPYRRRKGEAKGFTWQDYRNLIIATHHNLSAPLVWVLG